MTQTAEKILSDAMKLDDAERAELAVKLMDTLEPLSEVDNDDAWQDEIEARIEDLRSGRVEAIPVDQAMDMIQRGGKTNGDR